MSIGERLRVAREAIGFTLERAAKDSGIGLSSLCEFENDKREPKFSYLSRLADVYRKSVEFFLTDSPIIPKVMLWRDPPAGEESKAETEAQFQQLCEQYHKLELLLDESDRVPLPAPDVHNHGEFSYSHAVCLAEKVQREFLLGDTPSLSLKQVLEERYHVKIFHLAFVGSAISTCSEIYGPAVLLNANSKAWRRNYDLAHELFHLLTWNIFRTKHEPSEYEEKLANVFASRLLLPTDSVKHRIEHSADPERRISFQALDEVAREFGVSLEALLWRMPYLYDKKPKEVEQLIAEAKDLILHRPPRKSDIPDILPDRYCSLATRALRERRLSQIQFTKYMLISYKEAEDYLKEDEDFASGTVSIAPA